ncbi:MAG: sulfate adenylyltransferase [Anaerolineae bacterium]|nr:sulfate adenylyltransferase [Anaerolineae bacterium]MDW8172306.1 sulfate adenylyltransferase [Anaerolineae bacterium]
MSRLIAPHGGQLTPCLLAVDEVERAERLDEAVHLPRVILSELNLADLEMLAVGALSPLLGYQCQAEYEAVLETGRLLSGLAWTIPITLAVDAALAQSLRVGQRVALAERLADGAEDVLAVLHLREVFAYDKAREAQAVFRTTDAAHPGVARLMQQGEVLLAGPVEVLRLPRRAYAEFPDIRYTPAQTRAIFAERGWRRVVGFQTRNPIHRAHEYIQKTALEVMDGLLLHPLVGETKGDDLPAVVRVASYRAILAAHYPQERVLLAAFPAAMRYAGPKEAVFHAIARQNYGCSHFIVGRDHAGVGSYYGSYDAHHIFDDYAPQELAITPLFFEHTFYCRRCGQVASLKTCPHPREDHVVLSGTQVRHMLAQGQPLPEEFTRPEVSAILMAHAQGTWTA